MTGGEERLIVGRYRLRRSLGRGGMGVVWLATDEVLDRDVAIKEIQPQGRTLLDTDPEVTRALREARAAAKLSDHPGIVTVHDVVTDDHGLPWIVMQLLKGHSLSAELETGGPMPVDRAARIGAQVLHALDYAHKANVLHRDVKPGNVMLTGDKAVLTDFGIAVIDGDAVLTATGQLAGVPEYIAPERILGGEAVPATDVWSVGIMLYGMVAGRTPFRRGDKQATLSAALTREPDPDPRVGRLGPVIKGLLRKRPEERMSAGEAIARLASIAGMPAPRVAESPVQPQEPTEDPDSVPTPADNTLPSFPPGRADESRVAPDAPTFDPARPVRSGSWRVPLFTTVVVLSAAVAAVLFLVNLPQRTDATGPTTTSTTPPPEAATTFQVDGFAIDIPRDWQRETPTEGEIRDHTWHEGQADAAVSGLEVVVRRDGTTKDASALEYLTGRDQAEQENGNNREYDPIVRANGSDARAVLEYTYVDVAASGRYRVRRVAVSADDLFVVTFRLWANDAATLADRWAAARESISDIEESFRAVS